MLLKERPRSLHLFVATWTALGVDGPAPQDQGAPLHPFARLGLFGQLLDLAFLLGIEIAQCIGEVACVGDLMLARSGDVLNPIQEVMGMGPNFGDGAGRRVAHFTGGFHVGQMLEWQRRRKM